MLRSPTTPNRTECNRAPRWYMTQPDASPRRGPCRPPAVSNYPAAETCRQTPLAFACLRTRENMVTVHSPEAVFLRIDLDT